MDFIKVLSSINRSPCGKLFPRDTGCRALSLVNLFPEIKEEEEEEEEEVTIGPFVEICFRYCLETFQSSYWAGQVLVG